MKYLLPFYTSVSAPKTPFEIGQLITRDTLPVITMRSSAVYKASSLIHPMMVIAGQKPERDTELHYRNVLFIVFKLVGLYTQVEYHTLTRAY